MNITDIRATPHAIRAHLTDAPTHRGTTPTHIRLTLNRAGKPGHVAIIGLTGASETTWSWRLGPWAVRRAPRWVRDAVDEMVRRAADA